MKKQRRRIRKNLRKLKRELFADLDPLQLCAPDYSRAVRILKGYTCERFSSIYELEELIDEILMLTETAASEVCAAGHETITILMAAHGLKPHQQLENDMVA